MKTIQKMSPMSLKLTHRLIDDGRSKSFAECLKTEYRVVNRILHHHDFYEGVRAVLIDKNKSPKWNPARLEEITDEMIYRHFLPFENNRDELRLLSLGDYKFKSPWIGLIPTGLIMDFVLDQGSSAEEVIHKVYSQKLFYFSPGQEEHIRTVLSRKFAQSPDGRYIRIQNPGDSQSFYQREPSSAEKRPFLEQNRFDKKSDMSQD